VTLKVRLPNQQSGERNFHVFYQMMAGATSAEKEAWKLDAPQNFRFTNQGDVYTLQHFDDTKEWESLKKALHVLNFQKSDQKALFDAMAGLLHAGEMGFADDGDEGSVLGESDSVQAALQQSCALLGLKAEELVATLTTKTLVTRGETMVKKCKVPEAKSSLDSLVKAIYGRLFEWIVTSINYCIQVESSQVRADIGVLDIFGFECFLHNSFEQLCINYTNETLQQQFNQYVFKLEQLEYDKEKIEWSFISFPDNQDCLDLIEHKTQGILAFVDDECRLPRATDEKLVARMHKALESHPRFSFTHKMKRDCQFQIKHYAGPVVYTAHTFCVKNKDELPKEALSLMQNSAVPLLSAIFIVDVVDAKALLPHQRNSVKSPGPSNPRASFTAASNDDGGGGGGGGKGIKDNLVKSVGSAFRTQLASLMEKIFRTKPHYIRCLKPNDQNVPDRFHRIRTVEQLRYGGVLEAVRVARSGFPVRLSHGEFYHRYRPLCNPFHASTKSLPSSSINAVTSDGEAFKELNERLLALLWDEEASNLDPETCPALQNKSARKLVELSLWLGKHNITKQSVQLGVTKTFLRKEAHDMLEARRSRRLAAAARIVQAVMRGMPIRRTCSVICYTIFLLLFLFLMSLSLSYPSIAAYLHSLTRHDV
jgi:myosin-5